ncbi:hypothetical protein AMAG_10766 [Allomyces macrogynus ATCC 38327]|uniref:Uncharacterized protein n=1 Tax=Allomyces macrogynus (strain ATCC 38327) TaxID=578462 RepID=A0A0L0SRX9_ALLM3|nr:hypothetical protein AMAG_10766 [Allomyces macrogynus ATCC 38327]|eukprot:KNE65109.1 hypothetical protein AMAG_10766 [Allomyces macrogynus ATCC 38327]
MTRVTTPIRAILTMLAALAVFSTMIRPALASPNPDGANFDEATNLDGIEDHVSAGVDAAAAKCWYSTRTDDRHCSACYQEGQTKVCKGKCKKDGGDLYCAECGYDSKTGRRLWCR